MARLRILLADCHDVLRRGLRSLLTSHSGWSVCGEARSGIDAVKLASQLKPDVVILELELDELNGVETTRQIKKDLPSTEILLYTIHEEEYFIAKAFRAGARGHVLKTDSEATLIEAVGTIARHVPFLSTKAAQTLLKQMLKTGMESEEAYVLTDREREITRLLSEGKSNREIGTQLHISVKTVETHRSTTMRKLGFNSITELVRYAIRNGLIQA
jgi:DNA-binding NarL/FixJ family response regulator